MSRGVTCLLLLALVACTAAAAADKKSDARKLFANGGLWFPGGGGGGGLLGGGLLGNNQGQLAQIASVFNPLNLLPQVASALNPFNVVTNIASGLTSVAQIVSDANIPPVTTTMYIQVTKTYTKYPVCMATTSKTLPPCKVLSPPTDENKEHHFDADSAFHIGHGVGVLGQQLLAHPQLAQYAAYGPVPQGWAEHDQHVLEDQWHNQVRELYPEMPEDLDHSGSEIVPTAVPKNSEATATAMVESSRPKRDADEVSTEATVPLAKANSRRPHPRYLQAFAKPAKPLIPEITKTLYVTKVEKVIDEHVTATVVPHNCVPDHVPMCPGKPHHHHHQPAAPSKPKPHHAGHNAQYKSKPKSAGAPNAL